MIDLGKIKAIISRLYSEIQEFDKMISEAYLANFPVYGTHKYVNFYTIKLLKRYISIESDGGREDFYNHIQVRFDITLQPNRVKMIEIINDATKNLVLENFNRIISECTIDV